MMAKLVMPIEAGPGERRERMRRMRFWGSIALLMVLGGVAGFVTGATTPEEGWLSVLKDTPWLVFAGLTAMVVSFVAGSWIFFRQVDELELADNLSGSMLGLYAYAVLLPVWWVLWKLDLASEPNDWAIFAASFLVAGAVYVFRKVQRR